MEGHKYRRFLTPTTLISSKSTCNTAVTTHTEYEINKIYMHIAIMGREIGVGG